jgi:hypothetical protein
MKIIDLLVFINSCAITLIVIGAVMVVIVY